jgi:hypothetical protein
MAELRSSKKSKIDQDEDKEQEKSKKQDFSDIGVKFSKIAQNFQNSLIPIGLIQPGIIPGIGKVAVEFLKNNGIKTYNHLVGLFFMCDRDEGEFIERLEELGIRNQDARETAFQFHRKFHGY